MTIEEKARAYDEALDRMKYVVIVPKDEKALQALKETIFPELRESEDERIRKGLLKIFKQSQNGHWAGMEIKDIVAYLEKQKDISESKAYEILSKKGFVIIERELYNELCDKAEQKEQKPVEWSEEDETPLGWIIECFDSWKYQVPEFADQYQSAINWLKSLRPSWKPSEEQMKGLKFFLDFHRPQRNAGTTNWKEFDAVESLYEQLKKL